LDLYANFLKSSLDWIPLAVLLTSLLGSTHCIAMCGGLVLSLGGAPRPSLWGYHLGRLTGYSLLGGAAGVLGQKVFESQSFSFLPWIAAGLIALSFIVMGVQLFRGQSPALFRIPSPFLVKLHQKTRNAPFFIGLFSALLPCGWLHTFVLGAIATRNPVQGALYLTLFWLGTVPALSLTQVMIDSFLKPFQRLAPKSAGITLILIGLLTLSLKMIPLIESVLQDQPAPTHSCHSTRSSN
jgi:sulfite exporter TauE/SafE